MMRAFMQFIVRWLENGTLPIFIFDGEPFHLKSGTREKRHEDREARKKEIAELKAQIDQFGPMEVPSALEEIPSPLGVNAAGEAGLVSPLY